MKKIVVLTVKDADKNESRLIVFLDENEIVVDYVIDGNICNLNDVVRFLNLKGKYLDTVVFVLSALRGFVDLRAVHYQIV